MVLPGCSLLEVSKIVRNKKRRVSEILRQQKILIGRYGSENEVINAVRHLKDIRI